MRKEGYKIKYKNFRRTSSKLLIILFVSAIILSIISQKVVRIDYVFGVSWGIVLVIVGIVQIIKSYYTFRAEYLEFITSYSHQKVEVRGAKAKRNAVINMLMGLLFGIILGLYLIFLTLNKK